MFVLLALLASSLWLSHLDVESHMEAIHVVFCTFKTPELWIRFVELYLVTSDPYCLIQSVISASLVVVD